MISIMDFQAARYLVDGEVAGQAGNNHPTAIPSGLFDTADGEIQIVAAGERLWPRFCELAGMQGLLDDPRYATEKLRLANRDALNEEIGAVLRTRPTAYWTDLFNEGGIPCGPVYAMDQTFADPQVRHLGMAQETVHPELGAMELVANPINVEGADRAIRSAPPLLGQHTDQVLGELGLSAADIDGLRARGVV